MPSWRERLGTWLLGPPDLSQAAASVRGSRAVDTPSSNYTLGTAVVGQYDRRSWLYSLDPDTRRDVGDYLKTSVGVYACADLRSSNLAGLPLKLYTTGEDGKRQPAQAGMLAELLRRVNPFWTFEDLIYATELALCLWGEGFWVLERGKSRKELPREIWWAHPGHMRVIAHPTHYIERYEYDYQGNQLKFAPDEVVWFRYINPLDEFEGLSPISAARMSVDTSIDALKSNRRIFENGMQLGGIISPEDKDSPLSTEQVTALEEHLAHRFQGVDKAHKFAVLSGGVKVSGLGLSPKDAEFLGLAQWTLNDICRVFKVPPPMVQDFSRSTYANFEGAIKAFWSLCMLPESRLLARTVREQLLRLFPSEADDCEFDVSMVRELQEDQTETTQQAAAWYAMGVPLNRLLQLLRPELLPPGQDGYPWGDEQPAVGGFGSFGPSSATPAPEQPAKPKTALAAVERAARLVAELAKSEQVRSLPAYGSPEHVEAMKAPNRRKDILEAKFRRMLVAAMNRQAEKLRQHVAEHAARAALVGGAGESVQAVQKQLLPPQDDYDDAMMDAAFGVLHESMAVAGAAGAQQLEQLGVHGVSFNVQHPRAQRFLRQRAQRFAEEINETTWAGLKTSLLEGMTAGEGIPQLQARVTEVMQDRIRSSAETIARTEVGGAYNGGTLESYRQAEVVQRKGWLASLDDRTRESHIEAHGQMVDLGDDFEVGLGSGPAPGQIGLPEEDINCFPGDVSVVADGAEVVYRRRYVGELVEITTAGGHRLAGTPNHPILTDRGWIALGNLVEGQDRVCRGLGEAGKGRTPDVDDMNATFGEVFRAAAVAGVDERASGIDEQFHGDGQAGEVEIVAVEGKLRRRLQSPGVEPRGEKGDGALSAFVGRGALVAAGDMSGRGESHALVPVGGAHPREHGCATVTRSHLGLEQLVADGGAADAVVCREGLFALAGKVTLDEVISVRRHPFSGHVFNLQTAGGWYLANAIVAHNCRCAMIAIMDVPAGEEEGAAPSTTKTNGRRPT